MASSSNAAIEKGILYIEGKIKESTLESEIPKVNSSLTEIWRRAEANKLC